MKKILTLMLSFVLLLAPNAFANDPFSKKFDFLKGEPDLMPVNEAFVFDAAQQGNQLRLSFVIADGYYLYRDKLKFELSGGELGEIALPEGKMHQDEYFGEQMVYYTFVELPLALKSAAAGSELTVTFMGCAEGKLCFPPTKVSTPLNEVAANDGKLEGVASATSASSETATAPLTQQDSLAQMLSEGSLGWTLLIFFGLGVGLALTPCVFPMYPILSGIIVGQGKKLSTGRAFTLSMAYVQGMAITYSLLGLVVASAGMKYQAALQHPAVLIGLAILFFVLSLSMFGLYDLKLPSSWQEKMNSLSNNQQGGSLAGVFVMGVISGLVASPCTTAPLSGALIYVAQSGDLLQGFAALYVLSMGMGLPLLLMGTSGGKLLPRAGAWMEVIKTIFGFLLIAVSVMMIGRIWPGMVSDLLWAVWGVALAGYLLHQNKKTEFNWKQTVRSVLLMLGLLGAVSYGFQAVMGGLGYQTPSVSAQKKAELVEFKRIKSLGDLNAELAIARLEGKFVMLDLYADWCVACKEFEHITFPDAEVKKRLDNMLLLQADVTKSDAVDVELLENFGVLGLPTLLMFDPQSGLRDDLRVTGFMGPKEFAAHLDLLHKPKQ
ncbi:protein-disulfide reductase DsbD [Shewanella sp. JM162201]|uniref:Thiol:disulfide interchange protein DsbD n=1 Tax=Shewanella jiangmenensis TaxID=2837387 RepID=A0ABS5V1A5_9GAMM|nr:protein-disulfide reductase DsbD [Shewanella jiangmenensis]MBT1444210.1 protein-disulfide reductase DsbD [Shewanella jiangmenensis]